MRTIRNFRLTVCVLIILSGAACLIFGAASVISRLGDPETNMLLLVIFALLILACAVLDFICGAKGLSGRNLKNGNRYLGNYARLAFIVCIVALFLSLFNGMVVSLAILLFVFAALVPFAFALLYRN